MPLTPREAELIAHALGAQHGQPYYRNHFCADVGCEDDLAWAELERRGLAVRRDRDDVPDHLYRVTPAGVAAFEAAQASPVATVTITESEAAKISEDVTALVEALDLADFGALITEIDANMVACIGRAYGSGLRHTLVRVAAVLGGAAKASPVATVTGWPDGVHERVATAGDLRLDRAARVEAVIAAARELRRWDWTHLLVDHRDSEDVRADLTALDAALAALDEGTK